MSHSCDESYDAYCETVRKARKAHKCDACGFKISAGDRYAYVSFVFDSTARSVKRCGSCQITHLHLRELCRKQSGPYDSEGMWPDEKLACGLKYESEWEHEPPEHIARLPFLSGKERSELL